MDRNREPENSGKDVQAKGIGRHTEATAQFNNTKALFSLFFFSSHSTLGLFLFSLSISERSTKGHYSSNNSTKGLKKCNC